MLARIVARAGQMSFMLWRAAFLFRLLKAFAASTSRLDRVFVCSVLVILGKHSIVMITVVVVITTNAFVAISSHPSSPGFRSAQERKSFEFVLVYLRKE